MTLIHVPRPDVKKAMNPDRPVNALLKAQVQHLHDAERNLPLRHRTDIYINAIKTEGEAAEYIRKVTTAIQEAHEAAAAKRRREIAITAAADEGPREKKGSASGAKKKTIVKRARKT
jgi:ArsR family metal-binding transcriptional regulator